MQIVEEPYEPLAFERFSGGGLDQLVERLADLV